MFKYFLFTFLFRFCFILIQFFVCVSEIGKLQVNPLFQTDINHLSYRKMKTLDIYLNVIHHEIIMHALAGSNIYHQQFMR